MTTTPTPSGFPAASLRRRLVALIYEAFLLVAVLFFAAFLPQWALIAAGWPAPGWVGWLNIFAVSAFYFIWHWRHGGQTLAMKTWRIRVVSRGAVPPAPSIWLKRFLWACPSVLSGIGLIWALFDREHQFLHDRLAGTRIELVPRDPD